MKPEEKDLLIKDLCARLPYGVKVSILEYLNAEILVGLDINKQTFNLEYSIGQPIFSRHNDLIIKPYLRPMSSMTEKELMELDKIFYDFFKSDDSTKGSSHCLLFDFYNQHHLDYRGFIEKGLALEAPEGMYK